MKKLSEVKAICGYIVINKNYNYGYTARCEFINVEFKGGSNEELTQVGRAHVCSGGNYDKVEHAIHTTLSKLVKLPFSGGFHMLDHKSGSDFYGRRWFEVKHIDDYTLSPTIEIF